MKIVLFEQDGAPSHFALCICQYLDRHYPRHLIRKRGRIQSPPQSSKLFLKSTVYRTQHESLEKLRQPTVHD